LKLLTGGLSNRLYLCKSSIISEDNAKRVLVRIFGNKTELLIDREYEMRVIVAAHQQGFSARFYGTFENGCIYGFVNGRPMNTAEAKQEKFLILVAQKLAHFHKMSVPYRKGGLFETIRSYAETVPPICEWPDSEKKTTLQHLNIAQLVHEIDNMENVVRLLASPTTFCHNDLLMGNIIISIPENEVHFIDFEYANYGPRGFDIADHFIEMCGDFSDGEYPSKSEQKIFLRAYLTASGEEPTETALEKIYIEVCKFSLVACLYWGFWGLFQTFNSELDFPFATYALNRFNRFLENRDAYLAL